MLNFCLFLETPLILHVLFFGKVQREEIDRRVTASKSSTGGRLPLKSDILDII